MGSVVSCHAMSCRVLPLTKVVDERSVTFVRLAFQESHRHELATRVVDSSCDKSRVMLVRCLASLLRSCHVMLCRVTSSSFFVDASR